MSDGSLRLIDVESQQPIAVPGFAFLLTLEREPGANLARGHIRSLDRNVDHPFQSDAGLWHELNKYFGCGDTTG